MTHPPQGGRPDPALRHAPATLRNRAPILAVLRRVLPPAARVLEIASGSGEHAVFLAANLPGVTWWPSDADPAARASIAAWTRAEGVGTVAPPLAIDACHPPWNLPEAARPDAVFCANMVHIAPWEACLGLLKGAASLLPEGGLLLLYGPFSRGGRHSAPSNEAFDAALRSQNPDWGVRDLDAVEREAGARGLESQEVVEMPANNLTVIFRRRPCTSASGAGKSGP